MFNRYHIEEERNTPQSSHFGEVKGKISLPKYIVHFLEGVHLTK